MRIVILGLMAAMAACGRAGQDAGNADSSRALTAVPPAGEHSPPAVASPEELRPAPEVAPVAGKPPQTSKPGTPAKPAAKAPAASPPATVASAPSAPAPAPQPVLRAGTDVVTTSSVEITTRRNKAGEKFTGAVAEAVKDESGREVIPAGATVTFLIVASKEAENQNDAGTLVIRPISLEVGGESYELKADVTGLHPERKGRGVTGGDAAKAGAGAAAGAILGQIITRKASGTIIGGVVGGAVGTAVAVKSADKDLVIPAGSRIVVQLTQDFVRKQ